MRTLKIAASVGLILLFALAAYGAYLRHHGSPIHSQNLKQKQAIDTRARRLIDLFLGTCVRFPGEAAQLRVYITDTLRLEPIAENFAPLFVGSEWPGKAWSATDATGEFAIVVYENGVCAVKARRAVGEDAFQYLETMFTDAGKALSQIEDKNTEIRPGVVVHLRSYTVKTKETPYNITGSGTSAADVDVQSTFTFSPGDLSN